MARQRYYVDGESRKTVDPQALSFAKRLNQLLLERGWRQSDLTRRAQEHMPPGKIFGRHLTSVYARGMHMPSAISLEAMAKAFDIPITELVPEGAARVVGFTDNAIQVRMSSAGRARLKLDMELPSDVALEIMTLANQHKD